eukprot:2295018-Alexandrium_andersonii.AAC.1
MSSSSSGGRAEPGGHSHRGGERGADRAAPAACRHPLGKRPGCDSPRLRQLRLDPVEAAGRGSCR